MPCLTCSHCIRHDALLHLPRKGPARNLRAASIFGPVAAPPHHHPVPPFGGIRPGFYPPLPDLPISRFSGLFTYPLLPSRQYPLPVLLAPASPPPLPVPSLISSTSPSLSPFFQRAWRRRGVGTPSRVFGPAFGAQGRLRRPVPGGGSGPGFARGRHLPPRAGAPGSGESRRLVIAGARRRLGPHVLQCPRARLGAPSPAAPGARRRRARLQPRPRQAPRRPSPDPSSPRPLRGARAVGAGAVGAAAPPPRRLPRRPQRMGQRGPASGAAGWRGAAGAPLLPR